MMKREWKVERAICAWLVVVSALGATLACRGKAGGGAAGDTVDIAGGSMRSGFVRGVLRSERTLDSFSISKRPVTQGEFDACVAGGRCAKAEPSSCGGPALAPYPGFKSPRYDEGGTDAPATCVGEKQAEAFCRSLGGRLPTLDEWLLAARGPAPRRFSWGDSVASCDQHPLAPQLLERQRSMGLPAGEPCAAGLDQPAASTLVVGSHGSGASFSGLEDVLLTPGELLTADAGGQYQACTKEGSHCVVYSMEPASIDGVEPFLSPAAPDKATKAPTPFATHAYGFRCVFNSSHGVRS